MAALTPVPKIQFFAANGEPLVGGKLYSYAAGTTTPLVTYTDQAATSANTNPVILDSRGEANVWLGTGPYKLRLTTATDVDIWTVDDIYSEGAQSMQELLSASGSSLVGFIADGVGASYRTVQAKLRDTVSVKDFGAVGDGTTDDTAAIQAAIDYAYAARIVENAGSGLYVQEASIPVVEAKGLSLRLTSALMIPPQSCLDFSGAVIDATAVSGYVFAQGTASGFWKFSMIGGVVKHADTVFDFANTNQAGGLIYIDGTRFDDITVQVARVAAQSTPIHFKNCTLVNIKKAVTVEKCDFILFEDCLVRPTQGAIDTNEQVIFENSGRLEFRRLLANPGTITGSPTNIAWVANRYDASVYASGGRTGMFIARDCRFGGESGSMTAVNNYAAAQATAAGTQVILSGGDAYSADGTREASSGTRRCIVRLFAVPNVLEVTAVDGVENANLIDKATTTALTPTQDSRVFTCANAGANAGTSSYTGTFIPPELIRYAAPDPVTFNITSNVNPNLTVARGGILTNTGTGAATNIFSALPPAFPGMEISIANTQSGSGYIQVQTQTGEVLVGGIVSGSIYYLRINFGQSITLKCDIAGRWILAAPFVISGPSTTRPTLGTNDIGIVYLDTTLDADGKPIWWNGTAWIDATGAVV
jgi:hypothetical protein